MVGSVVFIACAGAQSGGPDAPVTIRDYCAQVGASTCQCMGHGIEAVAEGCNATFVPGCIGGRDPNALSGRTQGQTDACAAAAGRACEPMLVGIAPPECPRLQ